MPKRKRFGVMHMDSIRSTQNKTVQDYTQHPTLLPADDKPGGSTSNKVTQQASGDQIGSGLVNMPDKRREAQVKEAYANTKNYSGIANNYSYRIQMQRQINKVRKHQPNASLSKLIDLGEFQADSKLINDKKIRNIADSFKQHRANLRHGVISKPGSDQAPRTPVHQR